MFILHTCEVFLQQNQESFLCSLIHKRKNLSEFSLVGGKGPFDKVIGPWE